MESSLSDANISQEQVIREVQYEDPQNFKRPNYSLSVEIQQAKRSRSQFSKRVSVVVEPRKAGIKTIFHNNRSFYSSPGNQSTEINKEELADGDHFTVTFSNQAITKFPRISAPKDISKHSSVDNKDNSIEIIVGRCHCSLCDCTMASDNQNYTDGKTNQEDRDENKPTLRSDKGTLIITNSPSTSEESIPSRKELNQLQKRIDHLERKVKRQEYVVKSIDPMLGLVSTYDNNEKQNDNCRSDSTSQVGCSYVSQFTRMPERNFWNYPDVGPLTPSKATTIDRNHYSEQYGRNVTAYDGITSGGNRRRQSASMPFRRTEIPRGYKKYKSNPLRDYRLMDTVHYLAQGEFAPRDDGIKLTQSREAILSDIIWEDVCRTNWPNARLCRRPGHTERLSIRSDLQKHIDNLLRERIAHVERRRRRHYRVMKMNQRNDGSRFIGKTGDIIVASNKSQNQLKTTDSHEIRKAKKDKDSTDKHKILNDQTPGPSNLSKNSTVRVMQASQMITTREKELFKNESRFDSVHQSSSCKNDRLSANSSHTSANYSGRNLSPRYLVKKDSKGKRTLIREEMEHYILLPTLVVKTPSNMRRQKKFNELYQKILNRTMRDRKIQPSFRQDWNSGLETQSSRPECKDIGLNIRINIRPSEDRLARKSEKIK